MHQVPKMMKNIRTLALAQNRRYDEHGSEKPIRRTNPANIAGLPGGLKRRFHTGFILVT
jgi:hypothetical protein